MLGILKKTIKGIAERISGKKGETVEKEKNKHSKKDKTSGKEQGKREKKEKKKEKKNANKKERKKKGIVQKVREFISDEIELREEDLSNILEEFELNLISADVSIDVAQKVVSELEESLIGKRVKKSEIRKTIMKELKKTLESILPEDPKPLDEIVKQSKKRPFVIVVLGLNGSGKTTTLAKIAKMLKDEGISSVMAAGDTFREAAVEQLVHHGKALGIKVIKRPYGSSSASVASDAIAHAKANGIDVVLIDTAGRQDTNFNLMEELKKILKVSKPDLSIYVAEATSGNAGLAQMKSFLEDVDFDAIILTKLDCGAKGGLVISASYEVKKPLLFIAHGQDYNDLVPYKKEMILNMLFE